MINTVFCFIMFSRLLYNVYVELLDEVWLFVFLHQTDACMIKVSHYNILKHFSLHD